MTLGLEPIKITYIVGSLATGGAENQLLELMRHLDRSRFAPSLVLFDNRTAKRAENLVEQIDCLLDYSADSPQSVAGKSAGAVWSLMGYLHRNSPDLLHAHLPQACMLASLSVALARKSVLIGSRRSLTNAYRSSPILGYSDRLATRMCDYMVCNSEAVAHEVVNMDGVPPARVGVIYNGVDTERFRPGDRSLRQQYGWGAEHIVFGMVANFIPYKRHIDFVRAAELIAAREPRARFVMAGEDRGTLAGALEQVGRAGLNEKVRVIAGTAHPEHIFPALDVYLCTSETEGFSNVLLEASACGVPIVATRAGGNEEIVNEGETGFLVAIHDPAALAERALSLTHDAQLRWRLGLQARRRTEEKFALPRMIQSHEHLYIRALRKESLVDFDPSIADVYV